MPTTGGPGGPGGRLSFLVPDLRVKMKIKPEMKKANAVKKMW